ncbi:hypothetical protein BC628DRAFT_245897 [Trametes gibbosa]|nr:hypothetical protein BC628DRAFT_245897 [Trametes gibbosa]
MSPYESLLVKDESERVSMSHYAPGAYMSQNESATSNQPIVTPILDRHICDSKHGNGVVNWIFSKLHTLTFNFVLYMSARGPCTVNCSQNHTHHWHVFPIRYRSFSFPTNGNTTLNLVSAPRRQRVNFNVSIQHSSTLERSNIVSEKHVHRPRGRSLQRPKIPLRVERRP